MVMTSEAEKALQKAAEALSDAILRTGDMEAATRAAVEYEKASGQDKKPADRLAAGEQISARSRETRNKK
jgi:hypothetical protein